jgi:hypothetical protein
MLAKFSISLLLFWSIAGLICAQEVESASDGVEIVRVDLYNGADHYGGAMYYAVNNNSYPVYVSIYLTQAYLTLDGLSRKNVYVEPYHRSYLGYVARQDYHMPFHWYYKWKAVPVQ